MCLSSEELSTRMCHSVGYNQHSYGKQVSVDFGQILLNLFNLIRTK